MWALSAAVLTRARVGFRFDGPPVCQRWYNLDVLKFTKGSSAESDVRWSLHSTFDNLFDKLKV